MTAPKVPLSTRTRRVVLTDVFDAFPILRRLPGRREYHVRPDCQYPHDHPLIAYQFGCRCIECRKARASDRYHNKLGDSTPSNSTLAGR